MKIIIFLFLLIYTSPLYSQMYRLKTKSSFRNILSNNLSFQSRNNFPTKYLVQNTDIDLNVTIIMMFDNISSDSSVHNNNKIFLDGLVGSFGFGIMGAIIGYNVKKKCSGSRDVIQICSGDGHYARLGASIGGVSGSILGYLSNRKEIKQRVPVLKILIGSIAGGVVGYYLTDVTFGMSAIVFPPLGANILLQF